MALGGFSPQRVAAGGIIGLFLILMAFRLGYISLPGTDNTDYAAPIPMAGPGQDTWMSVYQQGHKIGYTHRTFAGRQNGYRLQEDVFMRVQTMGVVQAISLQTEAELNADMGLTKFVFHLRSNLFAFQAVGRVTGDRLSIVTRTGGDERRYELPMKEPVQLSQGLLTGVATARISPPQDLQVAVFDPMTMGTRPAKISFAGEEIRNIMGRPESLRKYAVDFMGARQYAWLNSKGEVVREEGVLGMALEKTFRDDALSGLGDAAAVDLTDLAAVDAGKTIPNPTGLEVLAVQLDGIDDRALLLSGGRQRYDRTGLLTVRREHRRQVAGGELENRSTCLAATPFIQTSHPDIRARAAAIVAGGAGDEDKARRIVAWVFKNIEKRPVLSVSNAVETLKNLAGDCTEHAVLVAALARAAGIPTLVEAGLVYQRGRFYYHAWNSFWLQEWGGWVTADAVMNQLPADVTHLRLVRGEAEQQLDLMAVVGRVKLTIKEMSP